MIDICRTMLTNLIYIHFYYLLCSLKNTYCMEINCTNNSIIVNKIYQK